MSFLSDVESRFPPSNNQLKTSSNPRNQATIQDGRVTVQKIQGTQTQSFAGTRNRGIVTTSRVNYAAGQAKLVKCYNCLGEAFQTKDLDAYDSDCDDISMAKVVLMANLSSCDSDVLFEESQDAGIQDTNSSTPNDLLVLSLVEQITDHVANLDKENHTNKMEYDVISVIDDEETLFLEEKIRSKILDKQNDLISIKQKINISPIDYSKLNKIKEDFGKRFVTQKEFSAEQAFWLKYSNYNPDIFVKSHTPVRIEAPSEPPKVSLVNESLKKLKYQLANFDKVMKKRTTPDAITVALKNELRKIKLKNVVDNAVSKPSATIAPRIFKLYIEPISHRLKNNRDAHEVYHEKTIKNTDTLHGIINALENRIPIDSLRTKDSNKPLLTSTGVNTTISANGSKPSGNTKKNRISRPPISNQKNNVEEHPRKDSMIPNGQKNTLAEYMILSSVDNRPPMLDKPLYDSWKIRMEHYMQNKEHGRMILESVKHGLLNWPSIKVDGVTRLKKYAELSTSEKLQADCYLKATNIIL
ncbi:hypothetical protein Tco_1016052 [Tanacetum coccineum]|uniref:Uncharacterized protein n=1 Tax=Tanacetum coccineum TaxID=301880 RepID=A0ABQ5FPE8_9ASTR